MTRSTATRLGWSLFGFSALLLAVASVLNLRRPQYADLGATTGELVTGSPAELAALTAARRRGRRNQPPGQAG